MVEKNLLWGIIVIVGVAIIIWGVYSSYPKLEYETVSVCFSDKCVEAEIANTAQKRARGLMFRESLDEDEGMLFVFEKEKLHPFWMKDTLISLDIIWIDKDLEVVHIATVEPCVVENCESYFPNSEARFVVEVKAGFAERNGVGVGDFIEIDP